MAQGLCNIIPTLGRIFTRGNSFSLNTRNGTPSWPRILRFGRGVGGFLGDRKGGGRFGAAAGFTPAPARPKTARGKHGERDTGLEGAAERVDGHRGAIRLRPDAALAGIVLRRPDRTGSDRDRPGPPRPAGKT